MNLKEAPLRLFFFALLCWTLSFAQAKKTQMEETGGSNSIASNRGNLLMDQFILVFNGFTSRT